MKIEDRVCESVKDTVVSLYVKLCVCGCVCEREKERRKRKLRNLDK